MSVGLGVAIVTALAAAAVFGPKLCSLVDALLGETAREKYQQAATNLRTSSAALERFPKAAWDRVAGWLVPLVDRPALVLTAGIRRLAGLVRGAGGWDIQGAASLPGDLFATFITSAMPRAASLEASIHSALGRAADALRGGCPHAVGWHIIGASVFAAGLVLFAVAEITLSAATFEIVLRAPLLIPLPSLLQDVTLAHVLATYGTVFISALVVSDLLHQTHFAAEFESIAGRKRWALLGIAAALGVAALLAGIFVSLSRADLISPILPPDLAAQLLFIAIASPIPVLLGVAGLVAAPALGFAWIPVILALGALLLIVQIIEWILEALAGVVQWITRVVDLVIRIGGVVGLVIGMVALALALALYFTAFAAPTGAVVVALLAATLVAWAVVWLVARLAWIVLRIASASAVPETALKSALAACAQPIMAIWNAVARSALGQRLGLRLIRFPDEPIEAYVPAGSVIPPAAARAADDGAIKEVAMTHVR